MFLLQYFAAFIGCIGFSFIFRINRHTKFAIIGSLIGTMGWIIYKAGDYLDNVFLQSFIAMLCVAIVSELLARHFRAPATVFITIGCFPLVPGEGIYNTMLYAVLGNATAFGESFLTTLGISLCIALAILISLTFFQVYKRIKSKDFVEVE